MDNKAVIKFVDKLIRKYKASQAGIIQICNCCKSEELQALDEECCCLHKAFLELLKG